MEINPVLLKELPHSDVFMWLVSCRRQGMLTQGPTPDAKCNLNIWSFTLSHLLDSLICIRNSVSTVLLLWMMWGWDRLGGGVIDSYQGWVGGYFLIKFALVTFEKKKISVLQYLMNQLVLQNRALKLQN